EDPEGPAHAFEGGWRACHELPVRVHRQRPLRAELDPLAAIAHRRAGVRAREEKAEDRGRELASPHARVDRDVEIAVVHARVRRDVERPEVVRAVRDERLVRAMAVRRPVDDEVEDVRALRYAAPEPAERAAPASALGEACGTEELGVDADARRLEEVLPGDRAHVDRDDVAADDRQRAGKIVFVRGPLARGRVDDAERAARHRTRRTTATVATPAATPASRLRRQTTIPTVTSAATGSAPCVVAPAGRTTAGP